jgi:transcriptional regulator GlxA family with amidase domain
MTKKEGPINIGIIVSPQFGAIDIFGVYTVFGVPPFIGLRPDINVHFIGKNLEEFNAIPPWPMRATTTFKDCPQPLDVLAIGAQPPSFMDDDEAMDFVAEAGSSASYLIGICDGALTLGAAGLLKGYKATCSFHSINHLSLTGAIPTRGHVVVDRNRYTSGPVIGAYDASLMVLGELCGLDVARELELHLEHLSEPPFGVGRPELAGDELTKIAFERVQPFAKDGHERIAAACSRRGI